MARRMPKNRIYSIACVYIQQFNFEIFLVSGESHSAEKCKRGPLRVFEHPFFCKIEKNEGGLFGVIKKICEKKSHKSEKTCTKKFGQGRDLNQRPSAWQTSKKPN